LLKLTLSSSGSGNSGFLFGEHGRRHLPLGGAMDAGIGAVCFPAIEIGLSFFETLDVSL
jgi:hypothetical protein